MKSACRISTIAEDWISKGFHIHVSGVELHVFATPENKVSFASVFSNVKTVHFTKAVKLARQNCLSSKETRNRWMETTDRAIEYVEGYDGKLRDTAKIQAGKLRALKAALEVYDDTDARI